MCSALVIPPMVGNTVSPAKGFTSNQENEWSLTSTSTVVDATNAPARDNDIDLDGIHANDSGPTNNSARSKYYVIDTMLGST